MKAATGQHHPVYEGDIESDLTDLSDGDDELEEEEQQAVPPLHSHLPPPLSTTLTRRSPRTRTAVETQPQSKARRALPNWRTTTYPTQTFLKWIHDGMIYLEAEYQRDVVWSEQKMSMLIDSIMNNYYMPPIIFCVKHDPHTRIPMQRICIDGKQRLTSIQRFMDGDLCHKDAVTGKKSWFNTKNIRGRKEMTEASKGYFENLQVVCVEYDDLEDKEERELFSRVQNGIALTPAERMQAFNGPYAELVRKVGKEVTKCFGDQLNWGKLRGRDFQSIAQILYLIEYSSTSTKCPPEPSTAKVETWLNSNVNKTSIPEKIERSARTVFLLLCVLVLDIDGMGWDEPFKLGPHKFSPIEFVLSAYMIFLHGNDLTISQLSAGVRHLRNYARSQNEELRFNSTTYKDLVKYVRKEVKVAITKDASVDDHGFSAFKWSEANKTRLQEEVEKMKTMIKSEGTSTLPPSTSTSAKRKGKAKVVDKETDLEMGVEDSDVPSRKKLLKQAVGAAHDSKPPKTKHKATLEPVSSTSTSSPAAVKTEKATKKRVNSGYVDYVDDKPPKKRKIVPVSETGPSTAAKSTILAGTKKMKAATVFATNPPQNVVKGAVPCAAPSSSAVTSGTSASSSSILLKKKPRLDIPTRKGPQSQLAMKTGISPMTPRTHPNHSILPSSTALSRKEGGTFPSSELASPSNTSPPSQPPSQVPSQHNTSTVGPPSFLPVAGAQLQNSTARPTSVERLSSLREAKQWIEKDAVANGGRSSFSPSASGSQVVPTIPRDSRPRKSVSGPSPCPAVPLPTGTAATLPGSNHQSSYGSITQPSQVPSQREQRPVHPDLGLPSPLSTPTLPPLPIPIPISVPSSSSPANPTITEVSTATTAIAKTYNTSPPGLSNTELSVRPPGQRGTVSEDRVPRSETSLQQRERYVPLPRTRSFQRRDDSPVVDRTMAEAERPSRPGPSSRQRDYDYVPHPRGRPSRTRVDSPPQRGGRRGYDAPRRPWQDNPRPPREYDHYSPPLAPRHHSRLPRDYRPYYKASPRQSGGICGSGETDEICRGGGSNSSPHRGHDNEVPMLGSHTIVGVHSLSSG